MNNDNLNKNSSKLRPAKSYDICEELHRLNPLIAFSSNRFSPDDMSAVAQDILDFCGEFSVYILEETFKKLRRNSDGKRPSMKLMVDTIISFMPQVKYELTEEQQIKGELLQPKHDPRRAVPHSYQLSDQEIIDLKKERTDNPDWDTNAHMMNLNESLSHIEKLKQERILREKEEMRKIKAEIRANFLANEKQINESNMSPEQKKIALDKLGDETQAATLGAILDVTKPKDGKDTKDVSNFATPGWKPEGPIIRYTPGKDGEIEDLGTDYNYYKE